MTRRNWFILALLLITLLLFLWLVDLSILLETLRQADLRLLLLAAASMLSGALLISLRWRLLLLGSNAPFRPLFYSDTICFLANIALHIPAPATRVLAITRTTPVTLPQSTSAMVVDRLLEQIMRLTALVLTIALAVGDPNQAATSIWRGLAAVALTLLLIFLLVRRRAQIIPPLARWLGRLPRLEEQHASHTLTNLFSGLATAAAPRQLLAGAALSLLMWSSFLAFHYLTLAALTPAYNPGELLGLAMLVLAVAPPSAPAVAGIYHAVVIAALTVARPAATNSHAAYALLLHAIQLLLWAALGLYALTRFQLKFSELVQLSGRLPPRPPPEALPQHKKQWRQKPHQGADERPEER